MARKSTSTRRTGPRGNKAESLKIVVEKHADGYVAYPLGLNGVVVGDGDSYDTALEDVKSAIRFHIAIFGRAALVTDSPARKGSLSSKRA